MIGAARITAATGRRRALFSAAQVPGAVLSARADAAYVATTGGLVDTWSDRVAPAQDGIGTTTTRPTYTAADAKYGGRGSIASASKFLKFGVAADWTFFHSTGGTLFLVFTAVGNGNYLLTTQNLAGTEIGFEVLVSASGQVRFIVGNGTSIIADVSTANFASQSVPNVLVARFDPAGTTKVVLDLNGVRTTLGALSGAVSASAPTLPLAIGANANGAAAIATLDYAELMVSSQVVSDQVADQLLTYAQGYYGCAPQALLADFTTQAAGAGSLAAYGLTFTRASSGHSVQTGTATCVTTGLGNDVPRFGRANDAWNVALVHEEQRINLLLQSRSVGGTSWVLGATRTAGQGSPDGTSNGSRLQSTSGVAGTNQNPAVTSGQKHVGSAYLKNGGTGGQTQLVIGQSGTSGIAIGPLPASYQRFQTNPFSEAQAAMGIYIADGRGGLGGASAGARDDVADLAQLEQGAFATEAIVTTTASASRGADMVLKPQIARQITKGRIALEVRFRPKMSSANHLNDSYLLWVNSANTYFRINGGTCAVVCTLNGSAYITPVAMSWSQFDLVELWVAAGGGVASEAKYRVNGGAVVTLSTGAPTAFAGAGSLNDAYLLGQGAATGNLSAWVEAVNLYVNGARPAWA